MCVTCCASGAEAGTKRANDSSTDGKKARGTSVEGGSNVAGGTEHTTAGTGANAVMADPLLEAVKTVILSVVLGAAADLVVSAVVTSEVREVVHVIPVLGDPPEEHCC